MGSSIVLVFLILLNNYVSLYAFTTNTIINYKKCFVKTTQHYGTKKNNNNIKTTASSILNPLLFTGKANDSPLFHYHDKNKKYNIMRLFAATEEIATAEATVTKEEKEATTE